MENLSLPLILYSSIFLTCILGVCLGVISFSFIRLLKKYSLLQKEYEKLTQEGREKVNKVIEELIVSSKDFNEEIKKKVLLELEQISKSQKESLKETTASAQEELLRVFAGIATFLKAEVMAQSKVFGALVDRAVDNVQKEYRSQLEAYRQQSLKKIEESLFNLIEEVASKVIGKSLTREEHESLVIKALEEAKKDNVF